ncbi:MAG: nucleoside/nucleotide kinase family protein [Mycobacteriales bacterium]
MLSPRLAALIEEAGARGRATVAFDGPDAAGKTTLADEVANLLTVPTYRASIDGFHAPAAIRMRRGPLSAEGYYHDSFDYDALIDCLLAPFAAGAATVRAAIYDFRTDAPRPRLVTGLPPGAVLLFDGVFLLRPRLRDRWTLSIYLQVSEGVTLARASQRDLDLFGSFDALIKKYRRRYLPGQDLYRTDAHPVDTAHIVIDNDDPTAPKIVKWKPPPLP